MAGTKALKMGGQGQWRTLEVASEMGPMQRLTGQCWQISSEEQGGAGTGRDVEEPVSVL